MSMHTKMTSLQSTVIQHLLRSVVLPYMPLYSYSCDQHASFHFLLLLRSVGVIFLS